MLSGTYYAQNYASIIGGSLYKKSIFPKFKNWAGMPTKKCLGGHGKGVQKKR